MKCHECGSDEHLIARCPQKGAGRGTMFTGAVSTPWTFGPSQSSGIRAYHAEEGPGYTMDRQQPPWSEDDFMCAPAVNVSGHFVDADLTLSAEDARTALQMQPKEQIHQTPSQAAHFPVITDGNRGHADQGALHMQAAAGAAANASDPWQSSRDPWSDHSLPQAQGT